MLRLLLFILLLSPLSVHAFFFAPDRSEAPTSEEERVAPSGQLIDAKRQHDKASSLHSLTLVPHKPNYLLLGYYLHRPQTRPFSAQFPGKEIHINPLEIKFQFSLKTLLLSDLIGQTGDVWAGYTNRSFWQAFNGNYSSPFRETNHEPELWIDFAADAPVLGEMCFKGVTVGMVHQSNGQWGELSRSWNRLYALMMFQRKNLYLAIKPWWRFPERESSDDNPDIEKHLGRFEVYLLKDWNRQSLALMLRNNLHLDGHNHGALQLDYTFPLHNQLRGYLQIFSGYGESLIDYDHAVQTVGVGIMLSNWL